MLKYFKLSVAASILFVSQAIAQNPIKNVNVFLGSSGDHGQLTPAASSPFSQLSILPQTYPTLHSGYEFEAKEILGFTHNRLEGVGCTGSGGLLLIKPFLGENDDNRSLKKISDHGTPGQYNIKFKSGISVNIAVDENFGEYQFNFPKGKKGFTLDVSHAFSNGFVQEEHSIHSNRITGWIKAKTTCSVGIYTIYYTLDFPRSVKIAPIGNHKIVAHLTSETSKANLKIAFSSVDTNYAIKNLEHRQKDIGTLAAIATKRWNNMLGRIQVDGDPARKKLFYSLLYRTLQSPYKISEYDGNYRATDGKIHQSSNPRYHGWAIWDNYKTQLPLISIAYPEYYQDFIYSIADLYHFGKYNFAGPTEPANSVRTEHSSVVLLDGLNKGMRLNLGEIRDALIADTSNFDFTKPDKYLESCYDMWATGRLLSQTNNTILSHHFLDRAKSYVHIWNKDFKDLTKSDVDKMSARNMYQGTIRQYRWSVPFDVKTLVDLVGGKPQLTKELDEFFEKSYFNRANEPDMQSQMLYYTSEKPYKYQEFVQRLALDTVIQFYFNDNSRGIDSHIDKIYKNEPKAFVRTMDDDAGAMSAWFVMTSLGIQQPLVGEPIYYLNVPLFPHITINSGKTSLNISVHHFGDKNKYISGVTLNGRPLDRLWVTHRELASGGNLEIYATNKPSSFGTKNIWVSYLEKLK